MSGKTSGFRTLLLLRSSKMRPTRLISLAEQRLAQHSGLITRYPASRARLALSSDIGSEVGILMSDREIWVLSAVRTAIGSFGGALKDVPMVDLATTAVRASLERAGVAPDQVGHVVVGNV